MATLKDSGKRQEFGTGAVRDIRDGKGRFDLLPTRAIREVAQHFEAALVLDSNHISFLAENRSRGNQCWGAEHDSAHQLAALQEELQLVDRQAHLRGPFLAP